jgi:MFS family permease
LNADTIDYGIAGRVAQRLPFFYGWLVVYIGFLGVFLMGATTFWGMPLFIKPMVDDTGWGRSSIYGALTARFIVGAFGGLLLGHFADRRGGPGKLLLVGLAIDGASLAALRWVHSPLHFFVLYGLVGGAGNTGMRLVQSTLVTKWFVLKRGTAVGFSSMGGGVSALIMVPVIHVLISEFGWRNAWTALAAIMVVLLLPMVPLAVRSPEDIGLLPDNGELPKPTARQKTSALTERSFRLGEAMRTWQFWLLLLAIVFGSYSLQTNTVIMVDYFEEIGFAAGVAASAISVYGLFSVSARFIWGFAADRLTIRPAIIVQALLTAIGTALLLEIGDRTSLYAVVAYEGVMLGGFPTLGQLVWPDYFGRMHIGSITGLTQFFTTVIGSTGPLIAGAIYDSSGTYKVSLYILVCTWLLCAAVIFAVRPMKRDVVQPAPEPAVAM